MVGAERPARQGGDERDERQSHSPTSIAAAGPQVAAGHEDRGADDRQQYGGAGGVAQIPFLLGTRLRFPLCARPGTDQTEADGVSAVGGRLDPKRDLGRLRETTLPGAPLVGVPEWYPERLDGPERLRVELGVLEERTPIHPARPRGGGLALGGRSFQLDEAAGRIQRDPGHPRNAQRRLVPVHPSPERSRHERARALPVPEQQARRPALETLPPPRRAIVVLDPAEIVPVHCEAAGRVHRPVRNPELGQDCARTVLENGRGLVQRHVAEQVARTIPCHSQSGGDDDDRCQGSKRRDGNGSLAACCSHDLGRGRVSRQQSRRERIAAGQKRGDGDGGARPQRRVRLQATHHGPVHGRVEPFDDSRRRRRQLLSLPAHQLGQGPSGERPPAREELVEDEPERIEVTARTHLASCKLLRRHVGRSSGTQLIAAERPLEAGKTEIGDPHLAALVQHHVLRLQIPVEDSLAVRCGEPGAELVRDVEAFLIGQAADAPRQRREVLAVHELHGEERHAGHVADVVDSAHRRMRHLAGDANLVVEARQVAGIALARLREELEGHWQVEREVVRPVHLAHAAATEQAHDPITARDHLAGNEALIRRARLGPRVAG